MRHRVQRIVPYTPQQLWTLVGDVERYPDFLPWVTSMRTWNQAQAGEGIETLDAEATVSFSFLRERFSTRVTRDKPAMVIAVKLLSGPFRKLENRWRFRPHATGGSVVEFEIEFEFKFRMLDAMLAANFDTAVRKLMTSFEDRAKVLYG
ncbi:MAG: ubiquinone-binding protein [Caulobacter sp.]|nr:ubiquinone-binding protein [Caulobacter sp.]